MSYTTDSERLYSAPQIKVIVMVPLSTITQESNGYPEEEDIY